MTELDAIIAAPDDRLMRESGTWADRLLAIGESILERWLIAQHRVPTRARSEGFRLLALHRQGAKSDPSFNACRETCRELVYHHNLVRLEPGHPETPRRIRLGAMVARHLALFIDGKLEVAGLGDFCCSSRSVRAGDNLSPGITDQG